MKLVCSENKAFVIRKCLVFLWQCITCFLIVFANLAEVAIASEPFPPNLSVKLIRAKQKVSFLFVDRNLEVPESIFGHTLLVAHNNVPPEPDSVIIEFAAVIDAPNFSNLSALFDEVEGRYILNYYFVKHRQYDLENRNMVMFEIDELTQSKENLANLLESKLATNLPYTFLNKNCSYYVGKLMADSRSIAFESKSINRPIDLTLNLLPYVKNVTTLKSSQQVYFQYRKKLDYQLDLDNVAVDELCRDSAENDLFNKATSAYIQYQLPRVSSYSRRQALADLSKNVSHPIELQSDVGVLDKKESAIQLGISQGQMVFVYSPLSMGFEDTHNEMFSGNYLQLMKASFFGKPEKLVIQKLTFWQTEAIRDVMPTSRYLDISYQRYGDQQFTQEFFARLGAGVGINSESYSVSVTPFMGGVYSDLPQSSGFNLELGFRGACEAKWTTKIASRLTETVRVLSSSLSYSRAELTNRYSINNYTNLLHKLDIDSLGEINNSIIFSINY